MTNPYGAAPPALGGAGPGADRRAREQFLRRSKAVSAALAAGGFLSLSVALLGADSRAASAVPASTSQSATVSGYYAGDAGSGEVASAIDSGVAGDGVDVAPDTRSAAS